MEAAQLSRGEVKRRLVRVCRELEALVAGSYGPLGRAQLVQANAQCPDALTATSVAERYFASVAVGDCPIANAYFHILKSKIRNHADGGLFLAGLSASLQLEIQEGNLAEIPHRVVSRGLQLVLDWILEYLDEQQCPVCVAVTWSSEIALSAVIRGIVSSKSTTGLDEITADAVVIPLIIQAFVSVFNFVVENPGEAVPVQLLFASDAKTPDAARYLLPFAIFRLEALRQVGDRLERLGATAVLSQKIIPKYLQVYLAAKGIFTLDRLSAMYIRGVQMLSGATILSDWRVDDSIISCALGFLSLITTQTIGSKQYIRLHRECSASQASSTTTSGNEHPVTTIAIAAPDRFAYDELSHVITTSLRTLASLIDNPYVVAGGGCLEIHLAALLRHRAGQLRSPPGGAKIDKQTARTLRQLCQTVTTFADCLENLAGRLCGSHATATDRAAMIEQVCEANEESLKRTKLSGSDELSQKPINQLFGWDPRKRSVTPVLSCALQQEDPANSGEKSIVDARIVDVLEAKKDALVLAIESVSSLARIASVVQVP
ncbi:hypothetical protein PF010_g23831 [Phytophthora fragariae]|uniref:Uncharacterized protein n=1 Tax=Phytophthora fragariae TaxID=53985 RepID=A0A6A3WUK5_9STRA|nr:hypothetical protein PF011_g23070 [Phytophthora fragariae]KAE9076607.1 hypothetical protein PF010_g23831 [Phytophthora fragariae]KAE9185788.1 hypothetical protein PF004_g23261 [Phytophthora fragariae]KAE9188266.1 hypothetical protein PF002_g25351 [Phytophthora fragariae]